MSTKWRIGIVSALAVAVVTVVVVRGRGEKSGPPEPGAATRPAGAPALPRLLDLGKGKCAPCKRMIPILKELADEYAGQFDVEIIDLTEHPEAGDRYDVKLIPTQIFLTADGTELWRHEGFLPKEEILSAWADLGVKLSPAGGAE